MNAPFRPFAADVSKADNVPSLTGRCREPKTGAQLNAKVRSKPGGKSTPYMTAARLSERAGRFQAQGDDARAKPDFQRALAIYEQVRGMEHSDTAAILFNLGGVLHAQGDDETAKSSYTRALNIFEKGAGAEHPHKCEPRNLATLLQVRGDYAAAKPLYEEALAISKGNTGANTPIPVRASPISQVCFERRAIMRWRSRCTKRRWTSAKRQPKPKIGSIGKSLVDLAQVLQAQVDYAAAKPKLDHALAFDSKRREEQTNTAVALSNLAEIFHAQGDYEKAKPLYADAWELFDGTLGSRHQNTGASIANFAGMLMDQGNYWPAKSICESALKIFEETLGMKSSSYSLLSAIRQQHDIYCKYYV